MEPQTNEEPRELESIYVCWNEVSLYQGSFPYEHCSLTESRKGSLYQRPRTQLIATSSPALFSKNLDKALGTRLEKEDCQGLNYKFEVFDVKTRSQVIKLILTLFFKIHFCFNLNNKCYAFWADPKSASVICVNGSRSVDRVVFIRSREVTVGYVFL